MYTHCYKKLPNIFLISVLCLSQPKNGNDSIMYAYGFAYSKFYNLKKKNNFYHLSQCFLNFFTLRHIIISYCKLWHTLEYCLSAKIKYY